jgi:hypothetical protein
MIIKKCFVKHGLTEKTVMIIFGQNGYFEVSDLENEDPDKLNEKLGVTKEQSEAMLIGSMFGWNVPGTKILYE